MLHARIVPTALVYLFMTNLLSFSTIEKIKEVLKLQIHDDHRSYQKLLYNGLSRCAIR